MDKFFLLLGHIFFPAPQVGFFTFEATPDNGKNSYVATIDAHREVNNSGLHYLYIQVCPTDIKVNTLQVQGDLTFHNPYGYLPVSTQASMFLVARRLICTWLVPLHVNISITRYTSISNKKRQRSRCGDAMFTTIYGEFFMSD